MASFKLLLSNNPDNSPAVIEVELLPCEPGFTLMSDSSTGQIKCACSLFFTSLGMVCDTSDCNVIRNKNSWISVYNNTFQHWLQPVLWTTAIESSISCL